MARNDWRRWFCLVGMIVPLVIIQACTPRDEEQKPQQPATRPTTAVAPIPAPAVTLSDATRLPKAMEPRQLMVSAFAETGKRLYAGWPLILGGSLWRKVPTDAAKDGSAVSAPLAIKAHQGSWQQALTVEVRNEREEIIPWPLHPLEVADRELLLGLNDRVEVYWWLDPAETAKLTPGRYTLVVSFNRAMVTGLPESVTCDRFHVRVEKEPASLDKGTLKTKLQQMARFALFKGEDQVAGDLIRQILTDEPENIEGLRLQAKLLLRQGKAMDAADAIEDAIRAHRIRYPKAEVPLGLYLERSEMIKGAEPELVKEDRGNQKITR